MALYTSNDAGWLDIYSAFLAQGAPGVVMYNGVAYRRVYDGDNGIIFTEIAEGPDKTSFGNSNDKWRGFYPPEVEGNPDE